MKAFRIIAAALVATLALSCNAQKSTVKVDATLPTAAQVDTASYLLGVNFGSIIKGNNFADNMSEINMTQLKKGIQDFLEAEGNPYDPSFGEQFDVDPNFMSQILNDYIMQRMNYKSALNIA